MYSIYPALNAPTLLAKVATLSSTNELQLIDPSLPAKLNHLVNKTLTDTLLIRWLSHTDRHKFTNYFLSFAIKNMHF